MRFHQKKKKNGRAICRSSICCVIHFYPTTMTEHQPRQKRKRGLQDSTVDPVKFSAVVSALKEELDGCKDTPGKVGAMKNVGELEEVLATVMKPVCTLNIYFITLGV